jgi:RNA-directed DNA polymerase
MAQTPQARRKLDEWIRHRLRAIQLKHLKRPRPIYRELTALGADDDVAKRVALYVCRW